MFRSIVLLELGLLNLKFMQDNHIAAIDEVKKMLVKEG
jgi:hypothetical protein